MRLPACLLSCLLSACAARAAGPVLRSDAVTHVPGLVAFWDFVQREPDPPHRFVAHVPAGATNTYALDAVNYVRDFWGTGRPATYADFPLLGRGPFGQALHIRAEPDPTFRPLLAVPRARLHDSPLDRKGAAASVSVVVWAIREGGNHALAGIWHEGTDLRQPETAGIMQAVRGQRQYALFAGLGFPGTACGHVSDNGAGSFQFKYALHKSHSAAAAPAGPADAPAAGLDRAWHCFAMTFDAARHEVTGWLDGRAGDRWIEQPQRDGMLAPAAHAWRQAYLRRVPGPQPGEDAAYPADQLYAPPEETPVAVQVLNATGHERIELRAYGYTKVRVTLRDGQETARELVALRLNPWWYPHGIYTPPDDGSGGPFTIGRVIHSARSVGFTGWIGGVAVFDRALDADELRALSALCRPPLETRP